MANQFFKLAPTDPTKTYDLTQTYQVFFNDYQSLGINFLNGERMGDWDVFDLRGTIVGEGLVGTQLSVAGTTLTVGGTIGDISDDWTYDISEPGIVTFNEGVIIGIDDMRGFSSVARLFNLAQNGGISVLCSDEDILTVNANGNVIITTETPNPGY